MCGVGPFPFAWLPAVLSKHCHYFAVLLIGDIEQEPLINLPLLSFSQVEVAQCSFIFQGVKIFDITSRQRITNVPRDDISLRPDMYPCSLCWKDNVTLIIGWGTSVKVILFVFISSCCYRSTEDSPEE